MTVDLLDKAKACQDPELRLKLLQLWRERQAEASASPEREEEPPPPPRPALPPDEERIRKAKAQLLRLRLLRCDACNLAYSRTRVVPWTGPLSAWIALVGEAPGYWEDAQGVPFVGKAGKLLDRLLGDVGLRREDLCITNACLCRPSENANPTSAEIQACEPNLRAQLELSGARIVVAMGNTAIEALGIPGPISRVQGEAFWRAGRMVLPAYHPAAALRDPSKEALIRQVLARAREMRDGIAAAEPEDLDPVALAHPHDHDYCQELLTCALLVSLHEAYPVLWALRMAGASCWPWVDGMGMELPDGAQDAFDLTVLRRVPAISSVWLTTRLQGRGIMRGASLDHRTGIVDELGAGVDGLRAVGDPAAD